MLRHHGRLHRITVNPDVMVGKPTIRGLRITVEQILCALAGGVSREDVLAVEFPEIILAALRFDPDEFVREMHLADAIFWYEQGKISQEVAATIAGMHRADFLLILARMGQHSFLVNFNDLDREFAHGSCWYRASLVLIGNQMKG